MWNEFLDEAKSDRKFYNTPVLVLGHKHSGKRSLVDSLLDVSKTTLNSKKISTNYTSGKMKLKGLAPILDYSYLNVLDLNDPDYRTHAKLQVYMVEDPNRHQLYSHLQKPELLKKAVVLIMLDFTSPWDFMEQLNSWVLFLQKLQLRAGLTIVQLQNMAKKIQSKYNAFKQPEFDENGQLKKKFAQNEDQLDLPLADGVLTNNLRMPIIVCGNKCDLQTAVLRDQSSKKVQFVMHHLRQFCVKYGASLIYTSIKNNSNLNILYEYILYEAYSMPLRFKPEVINEQAIFIPLGFDNPTLIGDSVMNVDVNQPFSEVIVCPTQKKVAKEQIIAEEDSEFFKKYLGSTSTTMSTITVNEQSSQNQSSISSKSKSNEATKFFLGLLGSQKGPEKKGQKSEEGKYLMEMLSTNERMQTEEERKTTEAQNTLIRHTAKHMNKSKQIESTQ